jgi:TM2 domain-containing membrane protein YozV/RNA polymerase subunit RPABC4/transcription elongation factor Spt4
MYCRSCGAEVDAAAFACPKCGVPPKKGKKFCQNCQAATSPDQVMCVECGTKLAAASAISLDTTGSNRIVAALLAILIGSFGVHKFIMGYTKEGVIMILVTTIGSFLFGLGALAMWIVALIEGITYLRMSDEEFETTYIQGNKGWL